MYNANDAKSPSEDICLQCGDPDCGHFAYRKDADLVMELEYLEKKMLHVDCRDDHALLEIAERIKNLIWQLEDIAKRGVE